MRKVLILIAIAWLVAITVVHAWLNLRFFDAKRGTGARQNSESVSFQ